jgi:23S rRNA pseudouridine1911/1915/1917 synthase
MGPKDLRVVYRDAHLLVIDKPAGLATTAPEDGESLFALARDLDLGAPQLHPLSRLDTQVTGLVTFARTAQANHFAIEARRRGRLRRRYLGITAVRPEQASGDYRWSIGIDPRDPKKRCALPPEQRGPGIKIAHTQYCIRAEASPLVALDLFPRTGRTHQLRVHLSAAHCPLAGDVAYGGPKRLTLPNGRVLTAGRVMLHCAAFHMPHPDHPKERIALELAPAEDMQALWRSAGGDVEALSGAGADPETRD